MKLWGAILLFLLSSTPALALVPSISNVPPSITPDQEFTVDVSLAVCPNCGNSYLRGVFFYPETSGSYSGFTQNNSGEWIDSSSDRTKYYLVTSDQVDQSTWSGQLKLKFDNQKSPGEYFFKVGRYTSAGDSSAEWSEKNTVNVIGPTPAPTSPPAPTPTPTHVPPSSTPKPSATPKPSITTTPKSSSTPRPVLTDTSESQSSLLSLGQEERISPVILGESAADSPSSFPWIAILMIGSGLVGLSISAFLLLRRPPSH